MLAAALRGDSTARDEYAELLAKAAVLNELTPDFDLLETLRLENGEFWLYLQHWQRLRELAEYFGFRHSEEFYSPRPAQNISKA